MSRSLTVFLRGLLVAMALSITAGIAHSQYAPPGVNPTHYWTYKLLDPIFAPRPIFAADQFFPQGVPLSVDSLERLINWVHKNGSPVVPDTILHYTWWNLREKLPSPHLVRVNNQFGSYIVDVTNLEFMLVPAYKNQAPPGTQGGPEANHYLCYRAFGFPPPGFTVQLDDEWRFDHQLPLEMEYLCNPCFKQHAGIGYPIVDTKTHLALFRIYPFSDLFYPFIRDQFFTGNVPVKQSPYEYLLVPSEKIDLITPTKTSTWGKIKTLYR